MSVFMIDEVDYCLPANFHRDTEGGRVVGPIALVYLLCPELAEAELREVSSTQTHLSTPEFGTSLPRAGL